MYRVKNTADDRRKSLLHRTATKFELEPNLGGTRIRLGHHLDITDEHFARVKPTLDEWIKKGMVEVIKLDSSGQVPEDYKIPYDAEGKRLDGPTIEEWMKAGYPADRYPPFDYAEKPSPGLTAFRKQQQEEAVAAQKAQEEAAALAADMAKKEEEAAAEKAAAEEAAKEVVVEPTPVAPPAPEPIPSELPPPPAPVVEEKTEKKSSGKKKLF